MPQTKLLLLVGFTLGVTWACGSSDAQEPAPGTEATIEMPDGSLVTGRVVPAPTDTEPGVEATAHPASHAGVQPAGSAVGSQDAVEPAGAEPQFTEVEVPAGTILTLTLESALASNVSRVEDAVQARVERSVTVGSALAIPQGAVTHGTVTTARASGKVKGRAQLGFRFDELDIAGDRYVIRSDTVSYLADSTKTEDAKKIGIGAGAGAVIGGLLGGGKGAGTGAAIGGGAGTAMVLSTAGDEVELRPGAKVEVSLTQPLVVVIPKADAN